MARKKKDVSTEENFLVNKDVMPDKLIIMIEPRPGGRKYPIEIEVDDEELVREAAKQLRIKFINYYQIFSDTVEEFSYSDIMEMVALDIATSHLRLERNKDLVSFVEKIELLNNDLGDYMKKQQ